MVYLAETEAAFDAAVKAFLTAAERWPQIKQYLEDGWLQKVEKWALYHTAKIFTRGQIASSRVEGAHATIKRLITHRSGDLDVVFQKLWQIQEERWKDAGDKRTAQERTLTNPDLMNNTKTGWRVELAKIGGKVGWGAIKLIHAELVKLQDAKKENKEIGTVCPPSCSLPSSHGLPCCHQIKLGTPIPKESVHDEWYLHDLEDEVDKMYAHIGKEEEEKSAYEVQIALRCKEIEREALGVPAPYRDGMLRRLNEPGLMDVSVGDPIAFDKHTRKNHDTTTRRMKSGHERRTNTCAICKKPGHNRTSCPQAALSQLPQQPSAPPEASGPPSTGAFRSAVIRQTPSTPHMPASAEDPMIPPTTRPSGNESGAATKKRRSVHVDVEEKENKKPVVGSANNAVIDVDEDDDAAVTASQLKARQKKESWYQVPDVTPYDISSNRDGTKLNDGVCRFLSNIVSISI